MKKNENSKLKSGLLVLASLVIGCFLAVDVAEAAQGLHTSVVVESPHVQGGVAHKVFGNVNYYTTANNLRVNFPAIARTASYVHPFSLRASGGLTISTSGTYMFRFQRGASGGNNWAMISIYNPDGTEKCDTDGPYYNPPRGTGISCNTALSYPAGEYYISFNYHNPVTYDWQPDPQVKMEWDTPSTSGTVWEPIPISRLDSTNWDGEEISIPETGMEQINYKIAGVGTEGLSSAELEFDLPVGITAGDILFGGTRLFWRNGAGSEALQVRNAATADSTRTVTGTRLTTPKGAALESVTAELPDDFFANSAGESRVYLSFPNLAGIASSGGIALVAVYRDTAQPPGVLKIRTLGEGVHQAASHPINFDITSRDPAVPLSPFFLFEDAESKKLLTTPVGDRIAGKTYLPRHNYMAMKYGTGSMPGEGELFMGYGSGINNAAAETSNPALKRIVPRTDGVPDLTQTDNWYPMFGREGPQVDVLSTAGNYASNKRNNSNNAYITAGSDGVFMDSLTIPAGNDWVSFQYAASDFYGDTLASLGSNESSYFTAAGLLYYDLRKMVVCPATAALGVGEKLQLQAYYWANRFGALPDDICDLPAELATANVVTVPSSWGKTINGLPAADSIMRFTVNPGEVEAVSATTDMVTVCATYNSVTSCSKFTISNCAASTYNCFWSGPSCDLSTCGQTLAKTAGCYKQDGCTGVITSDNISLCNSSCVDTTETCPVCEVGNEAWTEVAP